ncbi:MAG: hypothetical protein ACK5M3_05295 [Dysgonomonas sp.]
MKKHLSLIFFSLFYITSFGQINLEDSTVQAITYWDNKEVYEYKITNKQTKLKNNEIVSSDSIAYNVEISVLDSTANSYTVQWLYKSDFHNNLKVIYKINDLGEFEEVLNLEDIRKFQNNLVNGVLDNAKGNSTDEHLDKIKDNISSIFSTKEAIETIGIKEITQFHMFYGLSYKLGEILEGEIETPNILGSSPFTAKVSVSLDEIYSDGSYLIGSTQSISKEQLAAAVLEFAKRISKSADKPADLSSIENMDLENEIATTSEIHNSGWILYSIQQTTITNGNLKMIKECIIELE